MTDERFERELTGLLGDIAGREAPPSLRDRVARIIDETPVIRRPWFAAPMRLALAGVAVVAVVTVAFIVSQSQLVGPSPSASPVEPGPSATTQVPTPLPSSSPVEPSPSATTSPTTPLPTPIPATGWTGLDWSDGVTGPTADPGERVVVNDVLPWGSGYVGVGARWSGFLADNETSDDTTIAAAFLTSPDALHWTTSQLGEPSKLSTICGEATCANLVVQVVAAGDGLLAIGDTERMGPAPLLWHSSDGHAWTLVDSPIWRAAWGVGPGHAYLHAIAGGTAGIVAIGGPYADWGDPESAPVIAYSADGLTWDRIALSSVFDNAYLYGVTAYAGGFVIVGRTGEPDTWQAPGVGTPAAWISTDGRTWRQASVPGKAGAGDALIDVIAGTNGLFAVGRRAGVASGGRIGGWELTSGWTSTDGRTWRLVGDLGADLPYLSGLAGDGWHMVLFGRESAEATALASWSSTDGVTWTRLAFSGSTPSFDRLQLARVVPDGVVITGSSDAGSLFWFATATGP